MKNGDITTKNKKIQKIRRTYFTRLYSIKLENTKEMNEFLDIQDLAKSIM